MRAPASRRRLSWERGCPAPLEQSRAFGPLRAGHPRSQEHRSSCVLVRSKGLTHAGRSHPHPAGPEPHPLLALRRAGPALALRHANRPAVGGPGPPGGELLVQDRAHRGPRRGRCSSPKRSATTCRSSTPCARTFGAGGPRVGATLRRRPGSCFATGGAPTGRAACSSANWRRSRPSSISRRSWPRASSRDGRPELALHEFESLRAGRNPRPGEWVTTVAQHPKLADFPNEPGLNPIPRYACKMATGAGKTVVMAMLIAWAFCNRGTKPGDPRYPRRVLVVCPNLTIRERLSVLRPGDPGCYYEKFDIVAVRDAPGARQGQGAGDQLAPLQPGGGGDHGGRGAGRAARRGDAGGIRARSSRRPLGRRAADGAERRGAPRLSARAGQ